MSEKSKPSFVTGEVLPPEQSGSRSGTHNQHIALPPEVAGLTLRRALLGQLPYWGARRTIEAYRKAVEAQVNTVTTVREFYVGLRELEQEKARLSRIDTYVDAARLEAEAFLERAYGDLEEAQLARARVALSLSEEKRRLAEAEAAPPPDKELIGLIAENNRQAELARAQRLREEEEQKLADLQRGAGGGNYRQKRRQLEQRRRDYEELMADKAKDIERYGSEEAFPEWLKEMYLDLEDALADSNG